MSAIKNLLWIALVLAGTAAGWFARDIRCRRTADMQADGGTQVGIPQVDSSLADAKKQIAKLEQELASAREDAGTLEESQAPADAAEKVVASEASATDDGNVVIVSPNKDGDLFGSLKENLSEEDFSQVTNSFAQLRTRIAKRAKGRQEYLASIDVSGMSDSERANHSRFMELMAKREAIAAKMWNGIPDLGSIQELAQISIEMESSAKEERSTLARQMARELGYSGDDVEVIHDTIRDIYDCTNAGGLAGVSDLIEEAGAVGGNVEVKTQVKTQVVEP